MNYNSHSSFLTTTLSKAIKKENGIYFTHPTIVVSALEKVKTHLMHKKSLSILEPSFGSGEFVFRVCDTFNQCENINLVCIEYNTDIYKDMFDTIQSKQTDRLKIDMKRLDFLEYDTENKFDFIVGNPPYYVLKSENVMKEYNSYYDGRPNIFILFLIKSLNLLCENGILAFILPKNFLNCLYYEKTRQYIKNKFCILDIYECDPNLFMETKQETICIIIQNSRYDEKHNDACPNTHFTLTKHDFNIFGNYENIQILKTLYEKATSLEEFGFNVRVGNIVWNQNKNLLTDDTEQTRLIYSSDIQKNTLQCKKYTNDQKKNFIRKKGISKPMIVINRGYGVGNYKFEYCLIQGGFEYLVENHLICIIPKNEMTDDEMYKKYSQIIQSFEDPRTSTFIKLYFGNNSINTTELHKVVPIYL